LLATLHPPPPNPQSPLPSPPSALGASVEKKWSGFKGFKLFKLTTRFEIWGLGAKGELKFHACSCFHIPYKPWNVKAKGLYLMLKTCCLVWVVFIRPPVTTANCLGPFVIQKMNDLKTLLLAPNSWLDVCCCAYIMLIFPGQSANKSIWVIVVFVRRPIRGSLVVKFENKLIKE
jgi:hypothetical protein